MEDDPCNGWPTTLQNENNVTQAQEDVHSYHHQTVNTIADS